MPLTKEQPRKAAARAASFRLVMGSFHKTALVTTTKVGAVYSRIAATAREHCC